MSARGIKEAVDMGIELALFILAVGYLLGYVGGRWDARHRLTDHLSTFYGWPARPKRKEAADDRTTE